MILITYGQNSIILTSPNKIIVCNLYGLICNYSTEENITTKHILGPYLVYMNTDEIFAFAAAYIVVVHSVYY